MIEKLLNIKQLAAALSVPRSFITAAKRQGYKMNGGKSTVKQFLEWHKKADHFIVTEPRSNASNRAASASGKQRAPRQKRDLHTA